MKPKKRRDKTLVRVLGGESVTNLRLGDHGVVSVTQGGELQAQLPLHVPLPEELLHAPGGPLVVEAPGLGWVGDVTGVKQEAQNPPFVKAGAVMTARQDCLHLLQLREMHRHIWKYEGRFAEINTLVRFPSYRCEEPCLSPDCDTL